MVDTNSQLGFLRHSNPQRLILKLVGLVGLWLLLMLVMGNRQAHAFVSLHPDPNNWGGIPGSVRSALENCDTQAPPVQTPAFETWISPSGQPQSMGPVTVPSGQNYIDLEFHISAAVCYTNSAVTESADYTSSATASIGGSFYGIANTERPLSFSPYNEVGIYVPSGTSFRYTLPAGQTFTSNTSVLITLYGDTINHFTSGQNGCVGGGGVVGSVHDHGNCPQGGVTFQVNVNVTPPSPSAYTVQGYRVNQATGAPLPCGSASAGGQSSASQPFSMGPFTGGVSVSADTPTITCSGVTYTYVSRIFCYNSTIASSTTCSDGSATHTGTSNPTSPGDPNIQPGGPPKYIDFRFYYSGPSCPNVPVPTRQINFSPLTDYAPGDSVAGNVDNAPDAGHYRQYFYKYTTAFANHQIDSINPANSNYTHSDDQPSPNHGIILDYTSYFSGNPNQAYQPQINYHYNWTRSGRLYVRTWNKWGLFWESSTGGFGGVQSNGGTGVIWPLTTSSTQTLYGTVYGPSLGPCNSQPPTLSCSPSSQTVGLNQTATITATGGSGTFSWSGGGSPPSGSGSSFSTSWSTTGSHTVTVTSGDGQTRTCTVNINAPTLTCSPPNQTVNTGQTAFFNASGGTGSYTWSTSGASTNSGSGVSFSTSWSTTGSKTVTVNSPGATPATCNVNVIMPAPVIGCSLSATPATGSASTIRTLSWTVTGAPTGATIAASPGPSPGTVSPSDSSISWTVGTNTTFTMTVTKAGATPYTCPPVTVTVDVECGNPSVNANPGQTVFFAGNGGNGTYTWTQDPGGSAVTPVTQPTFQTSYSALGTHFVHVNSGGSTANCAINVTAPPFKPYLRVYGGDVAAGSGFGATCSQAHNSAQILTFNNGLGSGSGTQFAAFALDIINGFSTANGRPTDPKPPAGLSFSNTAGDPVYGGAFGNQPVCAVDYWSTSVTTPTIGSPTDVGSLSQSNYAISARTTLNGNTPIPNGKKLAIYATDDVLITGSGIRYLNGDPGNWWIHTADIPSFYLVVKGHNIYIDSSVTRLDGVYVALPDASGNNGTIYTCTNGFNLWDSSGTGSPTSLHGHCQNQLLINGSFIANRVKFQRTKGDIGGSSNGQLKTDPNIAEIFNYTADLWLTSPAAGRPSGSSGTGNYDSITSLPPVL